MKAKWKKLAVVIMAVVFSVTGMNALALEKEEARSGEELVLTLCPKDNTCPLSPFADTDKNEWYHDGVHWALRAGIMNGVSADEFAPFGSATRAMVVTMLWRMEGEPKSAAAAEFADILADAWYADAVAWALENGIVLGETDTSFAPDDSVTREQLAAILYRYAQLKGSGFNGMWAFPLDFADADAVAEYAYEPMCFLTMQGVITGMGDGLLAPKENATRAQIAAMFMRFNTEPIGYEEFKALDAERQKQVFSAMSGREIYDLVKNSPENWPVTSYDLISPENAKETIVLFENNGDLHFNLAWPCYGGFLAESIAGIYELSGKLDVSRDGGDGGYSMSYGKNVDGSYPNDSQRSVPKTSATVRTGILDADKYKKAAEIVISGESENNRLAALCDLGYTEEIAARLISDQAAWLLRDEVSGPDNISDGAKAAGHEVDGGYGYYGVTAPWISKGLTLEGGGGQLCTIFSWGTLCASGIISDISTAEIN